MASESFRRGTDSLGNAIHLFCKMKHPYKEYEASELWMLVKSSVEELVENNDIELSTPIEYVVGYICKNISSINSSDEGSPNI